jgi:hypothetical protein
MPSITYWSRLEPRPRAPSVADTLAARVRDPLWLLARQWQLGEFRGEDAGSPAFTQLATATGGIHAWAPRGETPRPLPPRTPLEPVALGEAADEADAALAVEFGQVFERALVQLGRPALVERFRGAYPLAPGDADPRDGDVRRLLELAVGRGLNGVRLFLAAEAALPGLPAEPALDPPDEDIVREALGRLRAWVRESVGPVGAADAEAWVPERLEYDLEVVAREPAAESVTLAAHPDRAARFDWHTFDVLATGGEAPTEGIDRVRRSVIPAGASFRGMPSARWWAFESGFTNIAAIRPEKREVAKLIVLDFMLVHGNDWFVLPFDQPVGTLCRVESLLVHDVFGGLTLVERADRGEPAPGGRRWTMFSTAVAEAGGVAGFFLLAPTLGPGLQSGEPVEEVRVVRDEMANMAWGVERIVPNGLGESRPGAERSAAAAPGEAPAPGSDGATPLRYRIQTTVPDHWYPFLPVLVDPGRRDIMLERGLLLRSAHAGEPAPPAGRILRPSRPGEAPYRLEEEELPRTGRRVVRGAHRGRWTDGRTFVWQARRSTTGSVEERSGLQFDLAVRPR